MITSPEGDSTGLFRRILCWHRPACSFDASISITGCSTFFLDDNQWRQLRLLHRSYSIKAKHADTLVGQEKST